MATACYGLTMAVVEIAEHTVAALRDQANARDLSLDAFLQRIAEAAAPINSAPTMTWAEIERSIDELATESPVLPGAFSRADIYADHD